MGQPQQKSIHDLAQQLHSDSFTLDTFKSLLIEIKDLVPYDMRNLKDLCNCVLHPQDRQGMIAEMIDHFALSEQFKETRLRNIEPLNIPSYIYKYAHYQKKAYLDSEYKKALGISKSSAIDKLNKHIKSDKKYPDLYFIKARNGVDKVMNFLVSSPYKSYPLYTTEAIIENLETGLIQGKFMPDVFPSIVKNKISACILMILNEITYKLDNEYIQSAECFIEPCDTPDNQTNLGISVHCVFKSKRPNASAFSVKRSGIIVSMLTPKEWTKDVIFSSDDEMDRTHKMLKLNNDFKFVPTVA